MKLEPTDLLTDWTKGMRGEKKKEVSRRTIDFLV